MLSLAAPTDPSWTDRVLCDLDELLLDHAHCEKKAAGMAMRLIFQYPEHLFLLAPLAALARDELRHFEQMLDVLAARDVPFRRQRPSPYAGRLKQHVRSEEPGRLIDTLLCCALIEARSCERMQLLAAAIGDPELAKLYAGLLASEARHHGVYMDLASQLAKPEVVRPRLAELAQREAEILSEPSNLSRMHT
jgi:tRNA-(ms[2]io[6]A)-hydroxylase